MSKEHLKILVRELGIDALPGEWFVGEKNLTEELPKLGAELVSAEPAVNKPLKRDWKTLSTEAASCTVCGLAETRKNVVFGSGNLKPRICFVGEAPGAEEDQQGQPFVGQGGVLLTKAITAGMGLRREDVYICNLLKCLPPESRNPREEEVSACRHFLEGQIELLQPEVIITLGASAQRALAGPELGGPSEAISKIRGQWLEYRGIPLMPTFHPNYLLQNPEAKKDFWQDLLSVMDRLGIKRPEK